MVTVSARGDGLRMRLLTTGRLEGTIHRARRRGKDLDKLWAVAERLLT